jgi:hypothetical protein
MKPQCEGVPASKPGLAIKVVVAVDVGVVVAVDVGVVVAVDVGVVVAVDVGVIVAVDVGVVVAVDVGVVVAVDVGVVVGVTIEVLVICAVEDGEEGDEGCDLRFEVVEFSGEKSVDDVLYMWCVLKNVYVVIRKVFLLTRSAFGFVFEVSAVDIDTESTSRTKIIHTLFIYLIVCVVNTLSVFIIIITIMY